MRAGILRAVVIYFGVGCFCEVYSGMKRFCWGRFGSEGDSMKLRLLLDLRMLARIILCRGKFFKSTTFWLWNGCEALMYAAYNDENESLKYCKIDDCVSNRFLLLF